jgi:WD40 repeat protein
LAVTHDQNIEIWDWNGTSLTLTQTITGSETQLMVKWSPDGTLLASADGTESGFLWATTIRFWNTVTWQEDSIVQSLVSVQMDLPFADQILWNPTGVLELIVIGDTVYQDNGQYFYESVRRINFIDPVSGNPTRNIPLDLSVFAAAWRPQGDLIALAGDYSATIYNAASGEIIPVTLVGDGFNINVSPVTLDWTNDGRYLATDDFVYDFVEQKYLGGFERSETAAINVVDWHPDNIRLATVDTSGRVKIEDASLFNNFVPPS